MKVRMRKVLEECIEYGISGGIRSAYKHRGDEEPQTLREDIEHYIWLMIDETFIFDDDEALVHTNNTN